MQEQAEVQCYIRGCYNDVTVKGNRMVRFAKRHGVICEECYKKKDNDKPFVPMVPGKDY